MGNQSNTSVFKVGDSSSILPFCWLEPGEGLEIGKNVGIGGFSLIFTHGVWSNYLKGGPVSHGSVLIKDNVWLAWRTFIMPDVTIEENSIVSACSFVIKDVPENVIVSGNPARNIAEAHKYLEIQDIEKRFNEILFDFKNYIEVKYGLKSDLTTKQLVFSNFRILFTDNLENVIKSNDLIFSMDSKQDYKNFNFPSSVINLNSEDAYLFECSETYLHKEFISFLRRYGIRIFINIVKL
jgi:hypothetical protein